MTNLSSSDLSPGAFIQITIPFGPGAASQGPKRALIIGTKLSTAPAATDTLYGPDVQGAVVVSRGDMLATFGSGSEVNLGYDALVLSNPDIPVYFICPPESSGNAADLAVTITGSATSFGAVKTSVNGQVVETPVANGDNATTIASNIAVSVNALTTANVSALASSGTVTLTCKTKGPRGNDTRVAVQVENGLTGVTSSAQAFTQLAGGTVADVWTNTLAVIDSQAFDYIVTGAEDPTGSGNLGELLTQMTQQDLAVPGFSQFVVDGYVYTQAGQAAFATHMNTNLGVLAWSKNSDYTPIQLAGHLAGCLSAGEMQNPPILNFDDAGARTGTQALWQFNNPLDGTKTSPTELQAALISGATPIVTTPTGKTKVAKAVSTYFLNPVSNTLDLRSTDHCDKFIAYVSRAALLQMWSDQFAGSVAANNPQPGDKAPNQFVVTPDILKASVIKVLQRQKDNGLLQDFLVQEPTLTSTGRFDVVVEIEPVDLAHQMSLDILVTTQSLQ